MPLSPKASRFRMLSAAMLLLGACAGEDGGGARGDERYLERECVQRKGLERGSEAHEACVRETRQYLEQQRALQRRAVGSP